MLFYWLENDLWIVCIEMFFVDVPIESFPDQ